MKNKFDLITIIFTGLCLFIFPICLVVMPKKEFSDNENRNLAVFPEISKESIISGEFMDGINLYLTDHFPFRDSWISVKTAEEILIGKQEINGIIIADDGYLIGEYPVPCNNQRTGEIFNKFAANAKEKAPDVSIKMMLVPTSYTINSDLYSGVTGGSQLDSIKEISDIAAIDRIDVYDTLMAHKEQQLFYRTDHHWTTLGAYYAYVEYCKAAGFEPVSLDKLESETVTTEFLGTYASKVNNPFQKKDDITVYINPLDKLTVSYLDTGVTTDSLYDLSYVDKKDKYSLFLSNLHPLIEITNDNAETDRVLMLVKDSYANSMVPFLVHHYSKIYVLDTRYYKFGPSSLLTEHNDITDIFVLYNMSTIETDTGIRGIF